MSSKPVPINIISKVCRSVCRIEINDDRVSCFATGFFLKVSDSLKYLITVYHVIKQDSINKNITLEIWNKKIMRLMANGRFIKYFQSPLDITAIEIKELDSIYKDIEFLDLDYNFIKNGYKIYKGLDIFSIYYQYGREAVTSSGRIIEIDPDPSFPEFSHNIPTSQGSTGCPIILLNDNVNLIKVIGIHKEKDAKKKIGRASFIGEIINEINRTN